MTYEVLDQSVSTQHPTDDRNRAPVGGGGPLPAALVWTERAAAAFRQYLERAGLADYRVFYCPQPDLHDIDEALPGLGESAAAWEPAPSSVHGGHPIAIATHDTAHAGFRFHPGGFLRLDRARVVVARWYWVDPVEGARQLWLAAAPCPEAFHNLRQEVLRLRRDRTGSTWTIVRGSVYRDEPVVPRRQPATDLLLSDSLRERLDVDLVRFFSPEVAGLYRDLGVPYRRGVLLHGPPGNGKTSLIRHIGASLPRVPGLILRPDASFDTDDLEQVVRRWTDLAPAILAIEDLDWLLERVNVSTFLNLIDGIDSPSLAPPTGGRRYARRRAMAGATPSAPTPGAGLLLIATTNHPEKLDPAVNNRPGRFDVAIEIPNPDDALRARFFAHHLPAASPDTVAELVALTPRLSFAHLHEVLRLSGLFALHAGHSARTDADLLAAARSVRDTSSAAARGFPPKPDVPFGLAALRRAR